MTLQEFVGLDPKQIRGNEKLMQLFVDFYEAAFSFTPKCVGCALKSGFKKLKKYANNGEKIINFETMETKTFKLKKKYHTRILSYKKDGRMYRVYGHKLTESFAVELVNAGQTDIFDVLPQTASAPEATGFDAMDYRSELLPLYDKVSEITGKQAESRKKADIIQFLKDNEGSW